MFSPTFQSLCSFASLCSSWGLLLCLFLVFSFGFHGFHRIFDSPDLRFKGVAHFQIEHYIPWFLKNQFPVENPKWRADFGANPRQIYQNGEFNKNNEINYLIKGINITHSFLAIRIHHRSFGEMIFGLFCWLFWQYPKAEPAIFVAGERTTNWLSIQNTENLKMARSYWSKYRLLFSVLFLLVTLEDSCLGEAKRSDPKQKKEKDKKIGKDVLDYTEADLFKLLDQWEVSTSCRFSRQLMCI